MTRVFGSILTAAVILGSAYLLGGVAVLLAGTATFNSTGPTVSIEPVTTPIAGEQLVESLIVEIPRRLIIPKLKIEANIQQVGLTSGGNMGIPSNHIDTAWFKLGPKPGEQGNAVIAGHLDSRWFSPGVFRNLNQLEAGDEIFVEDMNGEKIRFVVTSKETYFESSAPLEYIFGKTDKTRLNLITCDGAWDQSVKRYDQRLVVFTELAN